MKLSLKCDSLVNTLLANRNFLKIIFQEFLYLSPVLMKVTKKKKKNQECKRCSSLWFEGLLQGFTLCQSVDYGTDSPNESKWCKRVPNTRTQTERTKIIIYVSLSSLYVSLKKKGDS